MAPTFLVMITLGAIVYILNTQVCTADDDENACFDIDLNCKRKAKKGDCSSDWMNSRCRRSCKRCRHGDDDEDDRDDRDDRGDRDNRDYGDDRDDRDDRDDWDDRDDRDDRDDGDDHRRNRHRHIDRDD